MEFIFDSSVLKIPVDVNADGNIAMSGDTAVGSKNLSIAGTAVSLAGDGSTSGRFFNYSDAQRIFTSVVGGIFGATYVAANATQIVTRKIGGE